MAVDEIDAAEASRLVTRLNEELLKQRVGSEKPRLLNPTNPQVQMVIYRAVTYGGRSLTDMAMGFLHDLIALPTDYYMAP